MDWGYLGLSGDTDIVSGASIEVAPQAKLSMRGDTLVNHGLLVHEGWIFASDRLVNAGHLVQAIGATQAIGRIDLASGTLDIVVHDPDSFAVLSAWSAITLGGTLRIVAADGAHWNAGDRFVIATAPSITGQFDSVPDPLRWQVLVDPGRVTLLALSPVPEPAPAALLTLGLVVLRLNRRRTRG